MAGLRPAIRLLLLSIFEDVERRDDNEDEAQELRSWAVIQILQILFRLSLFFQNSWQPLAKAPRAFSPPYQIINTPTPIANTVPTIFQIFIE